MPEEKKNQSKGLKPVHNLIMEDRQHLTVSGVLEIERFDEEEVVVSTELGQLSIKGAELHLNKIDVEDGELSVEGQLDSVSYSDMQSGGKSGFLSKLFR